MAVAVASLAAALVGPSVSAAPPVGWSITSTNLSPDGVSDGDVAGFQVVVKNTGPSNISSLYLLAGANKDATSLITDAPKYLEAHDANGPVSCTAANGVICSFGAVGPGRVITVTVAYQLLFSNGTNTIYFALNTTGVVSGGNNSHGDVISSLQSVTMLDPELAGDAAGKWTLVDNDSLANLPVGGLNTQQTKLGGLASLIGAFVQDGSIVSINCPKSTCKAKPFGQTSTVHVAGGQVQDKPFQVTITIAKSQLPNGLNLNNVVVFHTLDNNTTQVIGDAANERCTTAPTTIAGDGCIRPTLDASGNLVIDVWVIKNGGFRGAN